jgi:hypothetical protein
VARERRFRANFRAKKKILPKGSQQTWASSQQSKKRNQELLRESASMVTIVKRTSNELTTAGCSAGRRY